MEPVIVAHDLSRRFGETLAVDRLNLEVMPGEVFGFLGHNGAGKTTTVRLLNGVLAPSGGSARVLGISSVDAGPALRRHTGVLTETASLDERLNARDNLTTYAHLYGVAVGEVSARVQELLTTFDLADRAREKVGGFSKGMKQRLALARALIHRPELLFLDEPTAGLDPVASRNVHELIVRLSGEGHTVFLCTHNLPEAERLCDRVAVLQHGRVVAIGTPAELGRRYGRSRTLELEVTPAQAELALGVARGVAGVVEAAHHNDTLTVAGVAREAIPGLVTALVTAGVQVYRVAPREATLEDVYFALQGEPGEAA